MVSYAPFYDDGRWIKETFTVTIGEEFRTFEDYMRWTSEDEQFGDGSSAEGAVHPAIEAILNEDPNDDRSAAPIYRSKKKNRDTRIGGNDAVNSYYQYCKTDDVRHTYLKVIANADPRGRSGHTVASMGRVYSEAIDDNQQLVYFTCGVPQYNDLIGFYTNAISADISNWINKGGSFRPGWIAGVALGTFIRLPLMPIIGIARFVDRVVFRRFEISKYYELKVDMPMYYQFVNSMLVRIAVNMGLLGDSYLLGQGALDANINSTLPESITASHIDIYRILLRKYRYEEHWNLFQSDHLATNAAIIRYPEEPDLEYRDGPVQGNESYVTTEDPGGINDGGYINWLWDSFYTQGVKPNLYDANSFVGFRIEKSTDSSESLSNSTKPSPVGSAVNAAYETSASVRHSLFGGNIGDNVVTDALEFVLSEAKDFVQGASHSVGLGGLSSLALGAARIDFPEIWDNSSFTKSYSFSMALRSPYGDPYSIFQSIYIPMTLILAAALPRATGQTSYTSPFLIRAYSKGMFAIPLGLIDSVSIKRGSDQHGWTIGRHPTQVDVSFTVKDLSPMMYQTMQEDAVDGLANILNLMSTTDSSFHDYLETLGGLSLHDRLRYGYKFRRRAQILLTGLLVNKLNPAAWGHSWTATTAFGSLVSSIFPSTSLPGAPDFIPGQGDGRGLGFPP